MRSNKRVHRPGGGRLSTFGADESTSVACYHCISRVVERRLAFGSEVKEQFVRLMRAYEGILPSPGVVLLRHVQPLPHHGEGQDAARRGGIHG
jgi:hypothetical protein